MSEQSALRPLLKPKKAAELLGISVRQLNNYRRAGKIPFIRISFKVIRYDWERIRAMAQTEEVSP